MSPLCCAHGVNYHEPRPHIEVACVLRILVVLKARWQNFVVSFFLVLSALLELLLFLGSAGELNLGSYAC